MKQNDKNAWRDRNFNAGLCRCGGERTPGRRSCLECQAKVKNRNDRRKKCPDKVEQDREAGRRGYIRLRKVVLEHYGTACGCCGEDRIEFLTIDHIVPVGSTPKLPERCGSGLLRWLKKQGFPSGFRTLCYNCNCSLGHHGYCPHQQESKFDSIPVINPRLRSPQ